MGKTNVVIYHPNSKVCAESKAFCVKMNLKRNISKNYFIWSKLVPQFDRHTSKDKIVFHLTDNTPTFWRILEKSYLVFRKLFLSFQMDIN